MSLPLDSVVAAVRNTLDSKGVLPRLRAELRLAVFSALEEKEKANGVYQENLKVRELRDSNNVPLRTALSLVLDFLNTYNLKTTATSLLTEIGVREHDMMERARLRSALHLPHSDKDISCIQQYLAKPLHNSQVIPVVLEPMHASHGLTERKSPESPPRHPASNSSTLAFTPATSAATQYVARTSTGLAGTGTFLTSMVSPASSVSTDGLHASPQHTASPMPIHGEIATANQQTTQNQASTPDKDNTMSSGRSNLADLASGGAFSRVSPSSSSPHSPSKLLTSQHDNNTPDESYTQQQQWQSHETGADVLGGSQVLDASYTSDSFGASPLTSPVVPEAPAYFPIQPDSPLADSATGAYGFHSQQDYTEGGYMSSEKNSGLVQEQDADAPVERAYQPFAKSITKSLGLGSDLARLARDMAAASDDDAAQKMMQAAMPEHGDDAAEDLAEASDEDAAPQLVQAAMSQYDDAEGHEGLAAEFENEDFPTTVALDKVVSAVPPPPMRHMAPSNRVTEQAPEDESSEDELLQSRRAIKNAAKNVIESPHIVHKPVDGDSDYEQDYEDDFDADASASASALSLPVPSSFAAAAAVNHSTTSNFSLSQSKDIELDVPEEILEEDMFGASELSDASSPEKPTVARVYRVNVTIPSAPAAAPVQPEAIQATDADAGADADSAQQHHAAQGVISRDVDEDEDDAQQDDWF